MSGERLADAFVHVMNGIEVERRELIDDPDHTAEACTRKFAEVRPLFASDGDPGDEHREPPRRDTSHTCETCGETVYHFHYDRRSFAAEMQRSIEDIERNLRSRPLKPFTVPAFATGGSMVVGTAQESIPAGSMVSLGADGKIAVFRASPGERIHVRTPQQAAAARRSWWRRLLARIRRAFARRPQ